MGSVVLEKAPTIRRGILLGLIGVLPLLFWRPALDPFNVPKVAVLVFAVGVVVCLRIFESLQGADDSGLKRLLVPAVALMTPMLIAWLASPYKSFALFGRQGRLQGLIPYLIVVLFGILLADAFGDSPRPIMWAFTLAGGGVGAYALIQYLQADPFGWVLESRHTLSAVSTLGNPNFTGGFLGMTLPVAVALWVMTPKHRKPLGFLILVCTGALIFTGSQGGWAAGLAGVAVVAGFLATPRWPRARALGYFAALAVLLVTVGVVIAGQLGVPRIPPTATARGFWWRAAGEMSLHSPIVGRGPSAFTVEGVQYRVPEEAVDVGYTFPDDPHSVPLAFLAAGGIIGLAGFATVGIWGIRQGLKLPDDDLVGAAFFAVVVAYMTQAFVSIDEVILRMSLWIGLAGLICARLVPAESKKKSSVKRTVPSRAKRTAQTPLRWAPALVPLVALASAAGWWGFAFLGADVKMHEGLDAFSADDVERGSSLMESAIAFRFDRGYQRTYASQLAAAAHESQSEEAFERADAEYEELSEWPDVTTALQHARLMREWSVMDPTREDEVMPYYRRALGIDDRNPILRVEAAEVLLAIDDPDDAVRLLEPMSDVVGDQLPDYWGTLGLALAQTGDETGAKRAIDRALELDPEQERALEARELLG